MAARFSRVTRNGASAGPGPVCPDCQCARCAVRHWPGQVAGLRMFTSDVGELGQVCRWPRAASSPMTPAIPVAFRFVPSRKLTQRPYWEFGPRAVASPCWFRGPGPGRKSSRIHDSARGTPLCCSSRWARALLLKLLIGYYIPKRLPVFQDSLVQPIEMETCL